MKCVTIVNADCQIPPSYDNAEFQILPNTTSETTAVYNCILGFYMSGRADFVVLVCGQENEWIGPEVDCTNSKLYYIFILKNETVGKVICFRYDIDYFYKENPFLSRVNNLLIPGHW